MSQGFEVLAKKSYAQISDWERILELRQTLPQKMERAFPLVPLVPIWGEVAGGIRLVQPTFGYSICMSSRVNSARRNFVIQNPCSEPALTAGAGHL